MEIIFKIFHTAVCCVIANKNCEMEIILLYYILHSIDEHCLNLTRSARFLFHESEDRIATICARSVRGH